MKRIDSNTKMTIQLVIAVVIIISGIFLLFMGFYAPPHGVIDNSVLIAYGESLTFAGALIGIDYAAKRITRRGLDDLYERIQENNREGQGNED